MSSGQIPFDVERYRSRRTRRLLVAIGVFVVGFALGVVVGAVLSRLQ
jgi:hypothetical protein